MSIRTRREKLQRDKLASIQKYNSKYRELVKPRPIGRGMEKITRNIQSGTFYKDTDRKIHKLPADSSGFSLDVWAGKWSNDKDKPFEHLSLWWKTN